MMKIIDIRDLFWAALCIGLLCSLIGRHTENEQIKQILEQGISDNIDAILHPPSPYPPTGDVSERHTIQVLLSPDDERLVLDWIMSP